MKRPLVPWPVVGRCFRPAITLTDGVNEQAQIRYMAWLMEHKPKQFARMMAEKIMKK